MRTFIVHAIDARAVIAEIWVLKQTSPSPTVVRFFMRHVAIRHDASGYNLYFRRCFILDAADSKLI